MSTDNLLGVKELRIPFSIAKPSETIKEDIGEMQDYIDAHFSNIIRNDLGLTNQSVNIYPSTLPIRKLFLGICEGLYGVYSPPTMSIFVNCSGYLKKVKENKIFVQQIEETRKESLSRIEKIKKRRVEKYINEEIQIDFLGQQVKLKRNYLLVLENDKIIDLLFKEAYNDWDFEDMYNEWKRSKDELYLSNFTGVHVVKHSTDHGELRQRTLQYCLDEKSFPIKEKHLPLMVYALKLLKNINGSIINEKGEIKEEGTLSTMSYLCFNEESFEKEDLLEQPFSLVIPLKDYYIQLCRFNNY